MTQKIKGTSSTMIRFRKEYKNEYIKAKIDGTVVTFRSRFEYRLAQYLDLLKTNACTRSWDYEGKLGHCPQPTFYFQGVKTAPVQYTPDFWALDNTGKQVYYETKGNLQRYDITKFKRMWEQYPDVNLCLVFMQRPKISAIRRSKLERYCYKIIWNAGTSIFTKKVRALIEW
jgi:hypothetical protein